MDELLQMKAEFSNLIRFVKPSKRKESDAAEPSKDQEKKICLSGQEAKEYYSNLVNVSEEKKETVTLPLGPVIKEKSFDFSSDARRTAPKFSSYSAKNTKLKQINIHLCAQNGDITSVQCCIENEMDINSLDQYGWTPLMCACASGQLKVVQLLLRSGADAQISDSGGNTAVSLAAKAKHTKITHFLTNERAQFSDQCEEIPVPLKSPEIPTFYCDVCKQDIRSQDRKSHNSSTVHLFNLKLKPKKDNFGGHSSNPGYQIMRKSGWDGEQGLGSEGQGQKYPIKTVLRYDRQCLGAAKAPTSKPKITHFGPNDPSAVQRIERVPERKMNAKTLSKRAQKQQELKKKKWEAKLRWEMSSDM